jgi:hypothetical protein
MCSSRRSRWISLCVTAVSVLIFAAVTANAGVAAKLLPFHLKPIGRPNAITIDQATGNVYVTDHVSETVKIFGAEGGNPTSGVPTEVTGAETPSGAFNFRLGETAVGVAVGEGGSLYVVDAGNRVVDKFKLEAGKYKYVCQFTGFGNKGDGCLPNLGATPETEPSEPFVRPRGVAVDTHGNVYIADSKGAVYEFNAADEDVREAAVPEPAGLAVDSNGVVYVQDFQGTVYKLTLNASLEFEVTPFDTEASRAVAVNPANNDVYVDHLEYVDVYKEDGTLITEVRPSGGFASEGVAVNGTSGNLYASNNPGEGIEVFRFVKLPDVRLAGGAVLAGREEATLEGEINPEEASGEANGASYFFEYGPGLPFAFSTSDVLVENPVETFLPATAKLTDLEPNTEYSYRLVGTNTLGSSLSLFEDSKEEGTFKTLTAPPELSEVEATNITAGGVTFSGKVNPKNTPPAAYRFEYGEAGGQLHALPEVGIAASDEPVPVEEAVPTGLKPGTAYNYRLVAVNSATSAQGVVSPEQTFTTPSTTSPPIAAPIVSTGSAVNVSQGSATLTGSVVPGELPTFYAFEIGSMVNGHIIFGTTVFGGGVEPQTSALESVPVEQAVGNLQPGVTYYFRLVASNAAGVRAGSIQGFTTATLPSSITQPAALPMLATPVFPEVKYPKEKKKVKRIRLKKKHSKSKHHAKVKVKKTKRK